MKITAALLMLLVLFLPNALAEEYTQWGLPEGVVARLGKGYLREVLYSPDGARLAVVSSIGIWLYDTTTYREVALLAADTDRGENVAFSPDGKTLAGGSWDGEVLLWDTETGEQKGTLEHTLGVESVAFSPDGAILASVSWDNAVRLWDTEMWGEKVTLTTGEPKGTLTVHTDRFNSVVFSPDGTTLASGSHDAKVRLWDAVTLELKRTFTGHTRSVKSVAFSPDGTVLASVSSDRTVLLWKVD